MKRMYVLGAALLAAGLLAGCTVTVRLPGGEATPAPDPTPAAVAEAEPTPRPVQATPTPEPTPTPAPEPTPAGEEVDSPEVFLTPEQYDVYTRADKASQPLFGDTFSVMYQYGWDYSDQPEVSRQADTGTTFLYQILEGENATLEYYEEQLLTVFTPAFLEERGFDWRFISIDGKLAAADIGIGGNSELSDVPDTFQLISADDNTVEFYRIAHYTIPRDGESTEDYIARRAVSYDKVGHITVRLVNTEDGWRVDAYGRPSFAGPDDEA